MSAHPHDVAAIVHTELRRILATDRTFSPDAVLRDAGVSSLKLLQLSARVVEQLGLMGDPPSTLDMKTVGDVVRTFERHLAEPRPDDLSLGASADRAARRRLRLRGSAK
jgi:acyl carrier protein